jgi:hypothetical protein
MRFPYNPGRIPDTLAELAPALREEFWNIKRAFEYSEPVQTPTFSGAWVGTGSGVRDAGYYMDSLGRVWLQGAVSVGVSGTAAWTMPERFWPRAGVVRLNLRGSGNDFIDISTAGVVTITTSSVVTALDGLSYRP